MDPREMTERGNMLMRYQPVERRQAILAMSTLIRHDATDIAPLLFAPIRVQRKCNVAAGERCRRSGCECRGKS